MVLDQPFPPDARVEREASALAAAGYEVHLLCVLSDRDESREGYLNGFYIHRVDPAEAVFRLPLGIRTRLPYQGALKNFFRAVWNIDTVWHTLIEDFVRTYGLDILHIHDLRLVDTGQSVANKFNLPLVADLHENYPSLMEQMKGKDDPNKAIQQRLKWDRIEQRCAQRADKVITVIEEARDRLIDKHIDPEKILVLPNTVDIHKFERVPVDQDIVRRYRSRFLLTYVGHINGPHRGIQTVIEAMALLRHEYPDIYFVAAGAYRDTYYAELMALIHHYGLENKVEFTGWMDETDFPSYIAASDVCLCPHLANDHTHSTFPNKVYMYHLYGKPVIASSCRPLMRYIHETRGGLCFESGQADDLAAQIKRLYANEATRKKMGECGQEAVLTQFNWEASSYRLVATYHELTGQLSLT